MHNVNRDRILTARAISAVLFAFALFAAGSAAGAAIVYGGSGQVVEIALIVTVALVALALTIPIVAISLFREEV